MLGWGQAVGSGPHLEPCPSGNFSGAQKAPWRLSSALRAAGCGLCPLQVYRSGRQPDTRAGPGPLQQRRLQGSGSGRGREAERRRGHLREGGGRCIYLEHFGLAGLLVCVLLAALLTVVLALPLGPDLRGPPLELPAALSTLG